MNVSELKDFIKNHKIKYKTIAQKSGIPEGTLRNIFSNSNIDPRYSTIEKIEKALGLQTEQSLSQTYFSENEKALIATYRSLSERDKRIANVILKELNDN